MLKTFSLPSHAPSTPCHLTSFARRSIMDNFMCVKNILAILFISITYIHSADMTNKESFQSISIINVAVGDTNEMTVMFKNISGSKKYILNNIDSINISSANTDEIDFSKSKHYDFGSLPGSKFIVTENGEFVRISVLIRKTELAEIKKAKTILIPIRYLSSDNKEESLVIVDSHIWIPVIVSP